MYSYVFTQSVSGLRSHLEREHASAPSGVTVSGPGSRMFTLQVWAHRGRGCACSVGLEGSEGVACWHMRLEHICGWNTLL